jgi:hypothetical protein
LGIATPVAGLLIPERLVADDKITQQWCEQDAEQEGHCKMYFPLPAFLHTHKQRKYNGGQYGYHQEQVAGRHMQGSSGGLTIGARQKNIPAVDAGMWVYVFCQLVFITLLQRKSKR